MGKDTGRRPTLIVLVLIQGVFLSSCDFDFSLGPAPAAEGYPPPVHSPHPLKVQAEVRFIGALSAGAWDVCAVSVGDHLFCWGQDHGIHGKHGWGASAIPISVGGLGPMAAVGVGTRYACGLDIAHRLYCWGLRIGLHPATWDLEPPYPLHESWRFRSLDAAEDYACVIRDDGQGLCVGSVSGVGVSDTLMTVAAGLDLYTVAAGSRHICVLDRDGRAFCWGSNESGQLGAGPLQPPYSEVPIPVDTELRFASINAGVSQTCALTAAGLLYCWGRPHHPTDFIWHRPTLLSDSVRFSQIQLSSSTSHACGVATDEEAWCWGWNDFGQLGNGSFEASGSPTRVQGGLRFRSVGTGGNFTCGITKTGEAYCWGKAGPHLGQR